MPKVSSKLEQTINFEKYINKYKKLEIQFFKDEKEGQIYFDFEDTVRDFINKAF